MEAVPDAPWSARRWLISGSLVAVLGLGGLAWATVDTTPPATSSPDTSSPATSAVVPVQPPIVVVPETARVQPVAETHPEPAPPVEKDKKGKRGKGKG
jgi:hypothetical protein